MGYYFIDEEYIKTNSPIINNVEVSSIVPFIKQVSDGWIQSILGTYFYNYLLAQYTDDELSADEELLVDKIKQAMVWRITSEVGLSLTLQLTQKGYQKQRGENNEPVALNELAFVTDSYVRNAEFYMERLRKYLTMNKDFYPQFTSKENRDSDLKPTKENLNTGGLYFI